MQRSITPTQDRASSRRGFTIVELLIVIVVIGILAAITIVAYSGITARAQVVTMQSDLAHLNEAIQLYHADNGSYPDSTSCAGTGWCGTYFAIGDNFIPGIAPKYMNTTPQQPTNAAGTGNGYLYRAPGGTDYKLIRLYPGELPTVEKQQPALLDGCNADRWGYWSSDISKCW